MKNEAGIVLNEGRVGARVQTGNRRKSPEWTWAVVARAQPGWGSVKEHIILHVKNYQAVHFMNLTVFSPTEKRAHVSLFLKKETKTSEPSTASSTSPPGFCRQPAARLSVLLGCPVCQKGQLHSPAACCGDVTRNKE